MIVISRQKRIIHSNLPKGVSAYAQKLEAKIRRVTQMVSWSQRKSEVGEPATMREVLDLWGYTGEERLPDRRTYERLKAEAELADASRTIEEKKREESLIVALEEKLEYAYSKLKSL